MGKHILAALLLCTPALAHQSPEGWEYDSWCCSNKDCAPIPASAVETLPDRIVVTLRPGDHPLVTAELRNEFPYDDERRLKRSGDMEFHACVLGGVFIRCLFMPPMGA